MIDARSVSFAYEDARALRDVSLAVDADESLALMGANGAGKTTLLKLLAGLYEPDAGSIEREGVVGFAPENPRDALFADTVTEEVAFFPENRGLDASELADRAMAAMEVDELRDRAPHALSSGEQRRVAIAAVLAGDPAVVALDEPTAGLDRRGERALGRLLADLDAAVVFSTHEPDFAYEFADRVAVLADGEVLRAGDPATVLADEELLASADVGRPGLLEWAEDRGVEPAPASFEEAVAVARGDR